MSPEIVAVQVLDAGLRHRSGKKQPCRIVVYWDRNGRMTASRKDEPPEGAPVLPISFALFKVYNRIWSLGQPKKLPPDEKKRRHNESQKASRKRIKEGIYLKPRGKS